MTTQYVGNRRLLKLADRLVGIDKARQKAGLPGYYQGAFAHDCGTPACSLGLHAASNVRRWVPTEVFTNSSGDLCTRGPTLKIVPVVHQVRALSNGTETTDEYPVSDKTLASGMHEFALKNYNEYDALFGGNGCDNARSGKQAARYIRKFVARRQKQAAKKAA